MPAELPGLAPPGLEAGNVINAVSAVRLLLVQFAIRSSNRLSIDSFLLLRLKRLSSSWKFEA